MPSLTKAILFYNKKSGQTSTGQKREKICAHFVQHEIELEVIIVPKPQAEIQKIVNQAIEDGVNLFIAAGGDGTVSFVGNALIGTEIPLGIIPLGTGNLLAKELHIPQKLEGALELLTSAEHDTIKIDTIQLEERSYILNVSVGVTPQIMEQTDSSDKQRLGFFAYLINFIQQILGLKLQRFNLEYDGKKKTYSASEILITNGRSIGVEGLQWSQDVSLIDGALDLFIIRAANLFDILSLLISIFAKNERMNASIKIVRFTDYCRIKTQSPIRIQADGDCVGETPVEVKVNPSSLSIIINKTKVDQ